MEKWMQIFGIKLREAIQNYPNEYAYPLAEVEFVLSNAIQPIRPIPDTKRYKSPAFDREFIVVKNDKVFEVWDIATGLSIPNTYATKKDAIVAIESNFNLTPAQIEYHHTKGIFAQASIAYSINKAIKSLGNG